MTPQQKAASEAASFVGKFNDIILFPTIALLSAVAFLVFLWGCAEYFLKASNEQAREQGVRHITWGIIGLVVMLSAFTILKIAAGTFGLNKQLECADDPTAGGCDQVFVIPGAPVTGSTPDGGSGSGSTPDGGSGSGSTPDGGS